MHRNGKVFIVVLFGIALLVGVAGADEFWEPVGFFAPSALASPGTQTGTPIVESTFFVPGQVPAVPAIQVMSVTPTAWSGTPGGFIAPLLSGAFSSPFIGPDPLLHPEAYEPIATGGSWPTSSTAAVSNSWDKWFSKPASPRSCSG